MFLNETLNMLCQDAIVSIKDGGIGFAKYSKSKNSAIPKFFFIYELENDSWSHVIEAMNNMIKYRKQNKIKFNTINIKIVHFQKNSMKF